MIRFYFLCYFVVITACTSLDEKKIRNDDIAWDGDDVGLVARIRTNSETAISSERMTEEQLLKCLTKKKSWIAAHVILTKRHGLAALVTPESWNKLVVILTPKGAYIAPEQQKIVQQFWGSRIAISKN